MASHREGSRRSLIDRDEERHRLGFSATDPSGCGAVVAHVLWEHEVVGSNPTTPTSHFFVVRPGRRGRRRMETR